MQVQHRHTENTLHIKQNMAIGMGYGAILRNDTVCISRYHIASKVHAFCRVGIYFI